MQVNFNNQILTEPQAKAKIVVGVSPRVNPLATGRVIVIGASEGGTPVASASAVSWFTDKSGAKDVLRSEDALRAMGMIFNPSNQHRGAPFVGFIRSQVATKAEHDATSMKIISKDYGTWVNAIKVQVEAGTTSNSTKITVESNGETEVHDNLDLAMSIEYVGSETAGKIEMTAGDVLTGTSGDTGTENTEFLLDTSLSTYNTLSKIVAYIDALADWECSIFNLAPAGVGTLNSNVLNTLAATSVGEGAAVLLEAYPNIAVYSLDTFSQYVDGSVETDGTQATVTTEWNFLAGGTAVSQATADITLALTLAEEANAQFIWIDSETAADHALVTAHCAAHGYRMGVYGGASVATQVGAVTAAVEAAALINSPFAAYVACGMDEFAEDGSGTEAGSPKFFAAKVVGLTAGQPVEEPITHKVFTAQGLQYEFSEDQRNTLIRGGVIAPRNYDGLGLIINHGINTMQNNVDLWDTSAEASPEISLMRSTWQFNKEFEQAADRIFIGGTVGVGQATIIGFIESHCKTKEKDNVLAQDDSDSDNILPAWENPTATRLAAGWSGGVSIRLNNPFNYFLMTTTVSL